MKRRLEPTLLVLGALGGMLLLGLMLPLANLFVQADWPRWLAALREPSAREALLTSVGASTISVLIMSLFGVPLGYLLAKGDLPLKRMWMSLVFLVAIIVIARRSHQRLSETLRLRFENMALIGELYKPEIALLPIGDLYTMSPREAAVAARMLQPKFIVPMHHGTFPALTGTPDALREELRKLGVSSEVVALRPGETLS